jgi:hypothetical protein
MNHLQPTVEISRNIAHASPILCIPVFYHPNIIKLLYSQYKKERKMDGKGKSKVIDTYLERRGGYTSDDNDEALVDLGYEDTTPTEEKEENIYGYGDMETWQDGDARGRMHHYRTPRRSSLKHNGTPRRASIGYTGEMTLVLPNGAPVQRRTSITFCEDQNIVQQEQQVADSNKYNAAFANAKPETLWFQKEEYQHIQETLYQIVKHTDNKKSKDPKDKKLCTRGLESLLKDNKDHMLESRMEAKLSVLEEQRMQRSSGQHDGEILADIYKFHAIDSSAQAAERAEQDAVDAANYTKATRRMMRRMSC